MSPRRALEPLLLALVVLPVLALGACGGGDEAAAPSAPPAASAPAPESSPAAERARESGSAPDSGAGGQEFAARASAACTATSKRLRRRLKQFVNAAKTRDRERILDSVERLQSAARQGRSRLSGIDVPAGTDGETAERFVRAYRRQIQIEYLTPLGRIEGAFKEGSPEKAEAAVRVLLTEQSSDQRANDLARELGAMGCLQANEASD